jgi:predicted NUDIX family NTP pyrophosphohydrolase
MAATSAGILLHRGAGERLEVLLILPGGPYWRGRDEGAWQIPKGNVDPEEEAVAAAAREFEEELGSPAPGPLRPLGTVRQAGGKWVHAFAVAGDLDADAIVSNRFEMEWPPRSGVSRSFPEVERAAWFSIEEARSRMLASQRPLLDLLLVALD